MKYSLGEGLADFGFSFLEKVHEPIFLIKKSGLLVNINEAGRKLMRVGGITRAELESYIKWKFAAQLTSVKGAFHRVSIGNDLHVIARSFPNSEYVMVEVVK